VLATQAEAPSDTLAAELADIGSHQVRVHQATGMVAAQFGVGVAEAIALLRARAWSSDRPISAVAADVVDRRLRFDS
jgi:AmiR/NasT family two-component response regulator